MERYRKYKIWIVILAVVAVIEAITIFELLVSRPKRRPMKVRPAAAAVEKGKIAIVLDDWGYSLNNLTALRQIRFPLTLSILPNLAYSKRINQEGRALGFEVILHLPMEPREKLNLEQNTIMTVMDEKTIKEILASDLSSISYAKGISNHMGSAAVNDSRTMSVIFTELKKRGLYFLDSYVSSEEVTSELASKMGLSFARRNVFLDNKNDPEYIKGQIYQLKVKARINGQAIGIGHDRRLTLQVLKEIMPQLEKEGYRFVFVSELVK
jgi:uncharacterized protein